MTRNALVGLLAASTHTASAVGAALSDTHPFLSAWFAGWAVFWAGQFLASIVSQRTPEDGS